MRIGKENKKVVRLPRRTRKPAAVPVPNWPIRMPVEIPAKEPAKVG